MFDKLRERLSTGLSTGLAGGLAGGLPSKDPGRDIGENLVETAEALAQKKREDGYERSKVRLRWLFLEVFEYEPQLGEPELLNGQDFYWVHGYLFRARGDQLIAVYWDGTTRIIYGPETFLGLEPFLFTWEQHQESQEIARVDAQEDGHV